ILELYLNHAPYGGNIVGYRAAALRYFRKTPAALSWAEAATLAVLPNAPGLIAPTTNPDKLQRKRNRLLLRLKNERILSEESYRLALLEPVPRRSYSTDWLAPHLTRWLHHRYPQQTVIRTTIDVDLQRMTEQMIREYSVYLQSLGIRNAAVLLVDNDGGKVRAYVGSPDFFDREHGGQVDGLRAPRSSGSILKPFLYALAMDEGLILPQTQIRDVPSYFGAFSPANFDHRYRGIVTAGEALVASLNVPAVRLLNSFGLHSFYYFLREAGLSTLFREPDGYGLPLIIGGAEVTPWEAAAMYSGLANGGLFRPISVMARDDGNAGFEHRLISAGAAYLTLRVLNDVKRPGSEYYWRQYSNQWPFSWKTGTSYGQRDAWAVGVSPQWTIAVWAGNFNGQGNANLSGAATAGPLLFDLFRNLPKDPDKIFFARPSEDLKEIELCARTGFKAGPDCPEKIRTIAPLHMKPLNLCPYHKRIFLNRDETEQVCSLCWGAGEHHTAIRLIYPADVNQFLRQAGRVVDGLPPHRASCPALTASSPLKIIYPQKNAALWIPREFNGELQKVSFRAAHQQSNQRIFWYLDNHYLGSSREKHNLAITLKKGWHELQVIDENGYVDKVRFYANLRE
ncbi:MAG TPA: penicillin-binding protein 1C, partial [Calditrichaeota bacterium]|nr:penicillin-binding protein 1C [Calditrichota bacterium]